MKPTDDDEAGVDADSRALTAEVVRESRALVDAFLGRERREVERLRSVVGSEVVAKLDRVTLRDLLHEHKEAELAALLGSAPEGRAARYRVIVSARGGPEDAGLDPRRAGTQRRRHAVSSMRRSGTRAAERIASEVDQRGGRTVAALWLTHSVVAEVTAASVVALAARGDVASVASDKRQIIASLNVSRPLIGAAAVEASGFDGTGVDVAVLDTGVDFAHPALRAVMGVQLDFTGEGVGDSFGHGTHCAGIVASQDKTFRGVAPGCTVHDYKVMDMNGSSTPSICISGIQQAVADGRDVLSASWGWTHAVGYWSCSEGRCVLCKAADAAAGLGSVFVVAAGNEDNDSCSTYDTHIGCPGNARNAVTVAASDNSDSMADFSSVGPTPDARPKPDVTAPGVGIVSARSGMGNDMNGTATVIGANFILASGTSMACPHVAGVCALMLDRNPTLTPAMVKSILMTTAVDIGATAEEMGRGRVDAVAAVNAS